MAKLGAVPSWGFSYAEQITTTKTLYASDCGKCFYLDGSGGAYTITLPALEAGLHFKFIVQEDTPTGAITISSPTASTIYWSAYSGNETTAKIETGKTKTSLVIGTSAVAGSFLEFSCDGDYYYVSGGGSPDNWVTD